MLVFMLIVTMVVGYQFMKANNISLEDKSPTFTELESRRLNKTNK